jgi:hypothetical protein
MTKRRANAPTIEALTDLMPVQLREPTDLLAAIPYVLGYHPIDCVVVVGLAGSRVLFVAQEDLQPDRAPAALPEPGGRARRPTPRMALPRTPSFTAAPPDRAAPGPSPAAGYADLPTDADLPTAAAQVARRLGDTVLAQRPSAVLVVGYGPAGLVDPVATRLHAWYVDAGVTVLEVLRAHGGRYWSSLCRDARCCPPEGSPYDVATTLVAARATLAGRVALPDRASYESQLAPVGGAERAAMRAATHRAGHRLGTHLRRFDDETTARAWLVAATAEAVAAAVTRHRGGGRLDDDELAWLTVLVASTEARDVAWRQIRGSSARLDLHRRLWLDVMRRVEPDLVAAPGSLFAFASWRCGDGALARLAVDRVLSRDPEYTMAQLMRSILARGLPPWAMPDFPGLSRAGRPGPPAPPGPRPRRRSSSRRGQSR